MKKIRFIKEAVPNKLLNIYNSNTVFIYRKRRIEITSHSIDRENLRTNLTEQDWVTIFKRIIDKCILLKTRTDIEILFYSKQYNQGIIVIYKPTRNIITIKTILPPEKHNAKEGTNKIIIEQYPDPNYTFSKEFIKYITNLKNNSILINETDKNYCYVTKTIDLTLAKFDIILCENKFRHLDVKVIEIE